MPRKCRLSWSELLRRVYKVDVLDCLRCQGRMKVIAFITDPPVVRKILDHLALRSAPLLIAPAVRQLVLPFDLIPDSDLATPTHDLFANDWLDEPIEVDRLPAWMRQLPQSQAPPEDDFFDLGPGPEAFVDPIYDDEFYFSPSPRDRSTPPERCILTAGKALRGGAIEGITDQVTARRTSAVWKSGD